MRLGTNYVQNSGANAALHFGTAGSHTRQNGTNQTTSLIEFGSLSGLAGSTFGGSAAGTGVFNYQFGGLNTNTTFAGNYNDGLTRTSLIKVGSGSLTLSGTANTFSGPSRVDGGSLIVDGALTNAALTLGVNSGGTLVFGSAGTLAGQVNVNAGGTLGGSGVINGPVNVVGGTIAPGTSPGTLTINNALTFDENSFLSFELNGQNTAIGGGINDLINSVTNLTLDGTLNINETSLNSFSTAVDNSSWRLINYSGALTNNGLILGSIPTLPLGSSFVIDTSTLGQVNLVLTAVPEPGSVALIGITIGLVGVARWRRPKLNDSMTSK
jgi:fibronectin-binding autotransporter adhesin